MSLRCGSHPPVLRWLTSQSLPLPGVFNKESSEWRDGDTLFLRCVVWQQSAENLADSLAKGTRVIVSGRLRQRAFETREGDKRTTVELVVDEVGVSLRYATVQITKTNRTSSSHE